MTLFKLYIWRNKGTAALEFAIVLPAFLLFLFGCIELGYVLWGISSLQYGASYGARYAFVNPAASSSTVASYALTEANFPTNAISYNVTIVPAVSATINGTFKYTFLVLPMNPINFQTQMTQPLALP